MEQTIRYIRALEMETGIEPIAVSLLCVMENHTLADYIKWLQDKIIN